MINHRHTPEKAAEVVADLVSKGIPADEAAADISIRAEFAEAVAKTIRVFGRWDILVADAAALVASRDARWITGQAPRVDGGMV